MLGIFIKKCTGFTQQKGLNEPITFPFPYPSNGKVMVKNSRYCKAKRKICEKEESPGTDSRVGTWQTPHFLLTKFNFLNVKLSARGSRNL